MSIFWDSSRTACGYVVVGRKQGVTARALLDAGADVRLADGQGRTPLELARTRGYREMERMLVAVDKRS